MNIFEFVLPQLTTAVPVLLVYLVGVVLSLVHLKRYPKPAMFALVGCSLIILNMIAFSFIQGYLVMHRNDPNGTEQDFGLRMGIMGIARSLFHAIAFSLLLTAIFIGRRPPAAAGLSVDIDLPESPSGAQQPHRATLVLVLGILSLIVCAPLGIATWVMGRSDLAAMQAGRMDRSGESVTIVGQVLGMVGTIIFALFLVGVVVLNAIDVARFVTL